MKIQWSKLQQIIIQKNTKKESPQLRKRDKIYMHTKNLKNKKPNKKLDAKKIGLFLIK